MSSATISPSPGLTSPEPVAPAPRRRPFNGAPLAILLPALVMLLVFIGWPLLQLVIM